MEIPQSPRTVGVARALGLTGKIGASLETLPPTGTDPLPALASLHLHRPRPTGPSKRIPTVLDAERSVERIRFFCHLASEL